MKIAPKSSREWLRFVLLPFKVYTVIAPLLYSLSASIPRPRDTPATDAEVLLVFGLFPCSAILLVSALVLVLFGRKGTVLPCVGFGAAALVVGFRLLPRMAT